MMSAFCEPTSSECEPSGVRGSIVSLEAVTTRDLKLPPHLGLRLSLKAKKKVKHIENSTGTKITIVLSSERKVASITGRLENISSAEMKMSSIFLEVGNKPRFTHFLSIPFNQEEVQRSFLSFKETVLSDYPSSNVDPLLFQDPRKLHMTFGIMTLQTESEKQKAVNILHHCWDQIIMPSLGLNQPFRVQVKGLEIMNNNPKKTRVLFAKLTETTLMQSIADQIVAQFAANGLIQEERSVKLHLTLMNSTFRERSQRKGHKRGDQRVTGSASGPSMTGQKRAPFAFTFDSTDILKQLGDHLFAKSLVVPEIHISSLVVNSEDGYYLPLEVIKFPA